MSTKTLIFKDQIPVACVTEQGRVITPADGTLWTSYTGCKALPSRLELMDIFRQHVKAENPQVEDSSLESFARNPEVFRYEHYTFLFKVWMRGFLLGQAQVITNVSGKGHCPNCGVVHTSDETCVQALTRINRLYTS